MKSDRKMLFMGILCLGLSFFNLKGQDTLRTYIFGNSLVNHLLQVHPTPSQETAMPHWFHFLAEEANRRYEVTGQYGFLPQHVSNLPPMAQWGFDSVATAWDDSQESFAEANFDNILITPANFSQWQAPNINYPGDSLSPLTSCDALIDWTAAQEDSLTFYIYEGWPDMASFLNNGFPPTAAEWSNYNAYLNADYHDWYLELHDSLILRHPGKCVRMIPVSTIISGLLSQSPFDGIAIDSLYEDDAPHGRPTIYFLSALINYMAMYGEPAPLSYQPPATYIDPVIIANYSTVVSYIWSELQAFNDGSGNSRVFCSPIVLDVEEETVRNPFAQGGTEPEIQVYPNPSNGRVQVRSQLDRVRLEVMDVNGRLLSGLYIQEGEVDLAPLPEGLYLLRIVDLDNGKAYLKKVIKQN